MKKEILNTITDMTTVMEHIEDYSTEKINKKATIFLEQMKKLSLSFNNKYIGHVITEMRLLMRWSDRCPFHLMHDVVIGCLCRTIRDLSLALECLPEQEGKLNKELLNEAVISGADGLKNRITVEITNREHLFGKMDCVDVMEIVNKAYFEMKIKYGETK